MRNHETKGYLIGVDLDGVLAWKEGGCWSAEDALNCEPIQENIDLLYKLIHAGHHIILYTARKEWWKSATEKWLKDNEIPYHALVMNKLPVDYLWDDRAAQTKDIKKLI